MAISFWCFVCLVIFVLLADIHYIFYRRQRRPANYRAAYLNTFKLAFVLPITWVLIVIFLVMPGCGCGLDIIGVILTAILGFGILLFAAMLLSIKSN